MTDWKSMIIIYLKVLLQHVFIPYYREGKLFNGTNRSTYEIEFYENTPPRPSNI